MSDDMKRAIGSLTKVNDRLSTIINGGGPEGSFKKCLNWLEEQVAYQNERIYSTLELLKTMDCEPTTKAVVAIDYEDFGVDILEQQLDGIPDEVAEHITRDGNNLVVKLRMSKENLLKVRAILMQMGLDMPVMSNNLHMVEESDNLWSESMWEL